MQITKYSQLISLHWDSLSEVTFFGNCVLHYLFNVSLPSTKVVRCCLRMTSFVLSDWVLMVKSLQFSAMAQFLHAK